MKIHKKIQFKHYILVQQLSCLFKFVYISYVFQSLVGLTVLYSNLEALYQLLFRLKLLSSLFIFFTVCLFKVISDITKT